MRRWLAIFLLLCGAYVLFVGPFSASEALAMLPALLGGFGLAMLQSRHKTRTLTLRAPWLRLAARLAVALVTDTLAVGTQLLRVLARTGTGHVSAQPFQPGGADARAAGRRGLVILGTSLAPNGFVTGITDDALTLHRLAPAARAKDTAWPL